MPTARTRLQVIWFGADTLIYILVCCHVENCGLSKTGMLLFWKGNRFCVCICFSQNTCQVAVADWLLVGETAFRRTSLGYSGLHLPLNNGF